MHILIKEYGADAPKTQLAEQALTKFAAHVYNMVAASESA
jgi:hypothetical protein